MTHDTSSTTEDWTSRVRLPSPPPGCDDPAVLLAAMAATAAEQKVHRASLHQLDQQCRQLARRRRALLHNLHGTGTDGTGTDGTGTGATGADGAGVGS
jgi:hypothetical protein